MFLRSEFLSPIEYLSSLNFAIGTWISTRKRAMLLLRNPFIMISLKLDRLRVEITNSKDDLLNNDLFRALSRSRLWL